MARTDRSARPKGSDRAPAEVRRSRLLLGGAVVLAAGILVAWFPGRALLTQRTDESSAVQQLQTLHREDNALTHERQALSDSSEIERIARQQYQLVNPGQQAFSVLPPSKSATPNAPYAGDPGNSGPVTPSGSSLVAPSTAHAHSGSSPGAASGTRASGSGASSTKSESTLERMLHTLEFWR